MARVAFPMPDEAADPAARAATLAVLGLPTLADPLDHDYGFFFAWPTCPALGREVRVLLDPSGDTFWQTVRRLKQCLDPAGILAPGRYLPASSPDDGRR